MAPRKRTARVVSQKDISVPVDAKLKKQWDELRRVIDVAKSRGAVAFDELWEAVDAIVGHDPPLYVVGGYGSDTEFFRDVLMESERTARRMIRVAKMATPAEEERYGTSKLDAILSYFEAQAGGPIEGKLPVSFERVRVPVTRDAKPARVSLDEATLAEVSAAARALSKSKKGKPSTRRIADALAKNLASSKSLAAVGVTERNGFVSFIRVPVAALSAFGRLIARADVGDATSTPGTKRPAPPKRSEKKRATRR